MPRIRTPFDQPTVDPGCGLVVLPDVNAPITHIDPIAPAPPEPRSEPRKRWPVRILRRDGTVELPLELMAPVMGAVLSWWRDHPDTDPKAPPSSAVQAQGISGVLDGVAAVLRAELRAAVVEAIGSTSSEPEDTSHLTARELADRLRVHVETIRRWSKQPGFPVRRIGPHAVRFDLAEVCAWRRTGT